MRTVRDKFRAISVERYKQLYAGFDPIQQGLIVRPIKVHGETVICAFIRKFPDGEWEANIEMVLTGIMVVQECFPRMERGSARGL